MSAAEYLSDNRDSYLAILWVGPDEDFRIPIPVKSTTRHPKSGSDLAVLWTGAAGFKFSALRLSTLVPGENTPIFALGYPEFDTQGPQLERPRISPNLKVTIGKVTNVYIDGRDTFRDIDGNFTGDLPTVSYETTAQIDYGMSGGPVMSPSGSVYGVISKGFNRSVPNEPDTSYISATPYIFMLRIAYSKIDKVSMYDLARRGIVVCDESLERLRMIESQGQIHVYHV